MASPPPYPDTEDDHGVESDRGSPTSTRWRMLMIWRIVIVILLLLVVVLHHSGLMGPGLHGGH